MLDPRQILKLGRWAAKVQFLSTAKRLMDGPAKHPAFATFRRCLLASLAVWAVGILGVKFGVFAVLAAPAAAALIHLAEGGA